MQLTTEKVALIREHFKIARSRQKSHADLRRKHVKFIIGHPMFLKVLTLRGIMRFGKRRKLSLRYVRPLEILERVGAMAYRLAHLPNFLGV